MPTGHGRETASLEGSVEPDSEMGSRGCGRSGDDSQTGPGCRRWRQLPFRGAAPTTRGDPPRRARLGVVAKLIPRHFADRRDFRRPTLPIGPRDFPLPALSSTDAVARRRRPHGDLFGAAGDHGARLLGFKLQPAVSSRTPIHQLRAEVRTNRTPGAVRRQRLRCLEAVNTPHTRIYRKTGQSHCAGPFNH